MAIQRTTPAAIGIGTALNSLGSSATAGAQTDVVTSGTTNNVVGINAVWAVQVGAITAGQSTRVDVYVWGTQDDAGYPGGSVTNEIITGAAGAITLSALGRVACKWLKQSLAHTTGMLIRDEAEIVSALGFVPRRWGLVFINQTGAALAASGHSAEFVETYYT